MEGNMFVNRVEELSYLEKLNQEKGARLQIVYGRRRIGKTELLKQFAKHKKHLFFSSDLSAENEQLRQFSEKIYQLTKEPFLEAQSFNSWEALLRYVFDSLAKKIPVIIIDEFPYLCMSSNALPSILQKVWDEKFKQANILLVLCGSYVSFMEKEILGSKSPLFGRRTGQLVLQPMHFEHLEEFFPNYSKEKRVNAYAILGGTPAYLQRFSGKRNIEKNIRDVILNKNSFLYSEPRFLLMEELREPSVYFSILKAIAFGKTRLNEIVQETGISDRHKINKYLTVLRELRIIRREVPVTEEKPYKSRKGIYLLDDPYFRFWFRYVFPNTTYLEEGDINYVWEAKLRPDFNSFVGLIFEDICTQKIKKLNKGNQLPFKAKDIGRWWDGKDEIDIIALDGKGSYLFCECKWAARKLGLNILTELENKATKFPEATTKYFGFFSKSGFTKEIKDLSGKRKDVLLFDY